MSAPRAAQRLALVLAGALLAAASAWPQAQPAVPAAQGVPSVSGPAQPRSAPRTTAAAKPEAQPTWAELTPAQQQSLAPLAGSWSALRAAHKRKWIALAANFAAMPPAEQARLHSRMLEWAALSPRQRTLARLNFGDAQAVLPGDRKAQWEAYQALPPEEKRRLAAGAAAAKPAPPPTAPAAQPVPQQKLVKIPKPGQAEGNPRLPVAPGSVDANTLLPKPAPRRAAPAAPAAPPAPPAPGVLPAPLAPAAPAPTPVQP
jgi:hypothetical protein